MNVLLTKSIKSLMMKTITTFVFIIKQQTERVSAQTSENSVYELQNLSSALEPAHNGSYRQTVAGTNSADQTAVFH